MDVLWKFWKSFPDNSEVIEGPALIIPAKLKSLEQHQSLYTYLLSLNLHRKVPKYGKDRALSTNVYIFRHSVRLKCFVSLILGE